SYTQPRSALPGQREQCTKVSLVRVCSDAVRICSLWPSTFAVAGEQRRQIATCLTIGQINATPTRLARGGDACRRYIQAGADPRSATAATRASSSNQAKWDQGPLGATP